MTTSRFTLYFVMNDDGWQRRDLQYIFLWMTMNDDVEIYTVFRYEWRWMTTSRFTVYFVMDDDGWRRRDLQCSFLWMTMDNDVEIYSVFRYGWRWMTTSRFIGLEKLYHRKIKKSFATYRQNGEKKVWDWSYLAHTFMWPNGMIL